MTEHVCKNCGQHFEGSYCNNCGEKVFLEKDKSVLHFFEGAFHFITHFEGTFFNTLRAVFFSPGKLSLDYCNGIRKKYFKPLPFFMFLVLLYLLFPFFQGLNMPFKNYVKKGNFASRMIANRYDLNMDSLFSQHGSLLQQSLDNAGSERAVPLSNEGEFIIASVPALQKPEASFNKMSQKTSKVLLLLLLPLTALVNWLLAYRKRRYFFDHLVLSTEQNAFFILFSFFLLPLFVLLSYKLAPGFSSVVFSETVIGGIAYSIFGFFCVKSFHRFYNDGWIWAVIKSILLIFAHIFIVQVVYKFILFSSTFYLS